jgi:DNA-directed RNA polymerase specialized sigma24 family protein
LLRLAEQGESHALEQLMSRYLPRLRRWAQRRPGPDGVPETLHDHSSSPPENAIGADVLGRYEAAMARLSEEERELPHLRIELDFEHQEIAAMTGRASRDAARMAIQRALARLADEMGHER